MKKSINSYLSFICLLSMLYSLCACAQKEEPIAASEVTTQITNPMIVITDAGEFETQLGIPINSDYLSADAMMFIIGGELAELTYYIKNSAGDSIECTLRATRSGTMDTDISGVYDEMTETTEEYSADDTVIVKHKSPKIEPFQIYEFEYNGNIYCFMYSGELSTELFEELIHDVFKAIGAEAAS